MQAIYTIIETITSSFAKFINYHFPKSIFNIYPLLYFVGLIALAYFLTGDVRKRLKQTTPQNLKSILVDKNYKTDIIPLENHIPSIYIFHSYINNRNPITKEIGKVLVSYLINWLAEGLIDYKTIEDNGLFNDTYLEIIFLQDKSTFTYESEKSSYENLKSLENNNSFDEKDLKNDISEKTNKYREFENLLIDEGINFSIDHGYLYRDEKDILYLTDQGKEEYKNLIGLNNYLEEISGFKDNILDSKDKFINLINVSIILEKYNKIADELEEKYPSYKLNDGRNTPAYEDIRRIVKFSWEATSQYKTSTDT